MAIIRHDGETSRGPSQNEPSEGVDWARIGVALRRRKFFIAAVLILGSAAGFFLGRAVAPTYLVEGRIWIDNPTGRATALGPIQSGQFLETSAWEELLRSYRVLDDVVVRLRLYLDVEPGADPALFETFAVAQDFQPGKYLLVADERGKGFSLFATEERNLQVGSGEIGDSIGAGRGFLWVIPKETLQPGQEVRFTVLSIRDASRSLAERLGSQMNQRGNFLRVTLRNEESGPLPTRPADPALMAATLNALLRRVVSVAGELKRSTFSERTDILRSQLTSAQGQLQASDAALQSFRVRTITLPGGGSDLAAAGDAGSTTQPVLENFSKLRADRERLQVSREAIVGVLEAAPAGRFPVDALMGIPLVGESGEIGKLIDELTSKRTELRIALLRYTEDSPPVVALQRQISALEEEAIPARARELLTEVERREAVMDGQIATQAASLRGIPPRILEDGRLQQRASLDQELFNTLRQRYEEARLAEVSSLPDLRILDEAAVPRVPESTPGPKILLMALMGSLGLALVGAILLDRVDPRVRHPSQITQGMGLSVLGAIPWMKSGRGRAKSEALITEAFRSLRLNLDHAYGAAEPMIVAITSSASGDGKSFVCSNLAKAFIRQGRSTVVIDADTRRGTLHEVFRSSRRPGLTDYLSGDVGVGRLVRRTKDASAAFIPAGTRRADSPERLNSRQMMELLAHLKASYQVILIDTPPIGAGADAFGLATVAGSLLFVLRTGATELVNAEANLDTLDRLPVRVLGAVLNDIPVGEQAFRHYGYLSSYQIKADEEDGPALLGPASQNGAGQALQTVPPQDR